MKPKYSLTIDTIILEPKFDKNAKYIPYILAPAYIIGFLSLIFGALISPLALLIGCSIAFFLFMPFTAIVNIYCHLHTVYPKSWKDDDGI